MTTASQPHSQPQPDNLLGICAAIGHDLGVDPLWLRVALGAGILWNPVAVLATYLGMGLVVLATRWLFPDRKPEPAAVIPMPLATSGDEPVAYKLAA